MGDGGFKPSIDTTLRVKVGVRAPKNNINELYRAADKFKQNDTIQLFVVIIIISGIYLNRAQ